MKLRRTKGFTVRAADGRTIRRGVTRDQAERISVLNIARNPEVTGPDGKVVISTRAGRLTP